MTAVVKQLQNEKAVRQCESGIEVYVCLFN